MTPTVTNWTADNKQFSLLFDENPLADFVELPDDGRAQDELWFSNILCGVLRGALEMVRAQVLRHHNNFGSLYSRSKCPSRLISSVMYFEATMSQRCESHWSGISRMRCPLTTNESTIALHEDANNKHEIKVLSGMV